MVKAWFMDDSDADQRLPHQQAPNAEVTSAQLDELGVLQFKLDSFSDNYNPDEDEQLKTIRKERGYAYTDTIIVSPEKLPNYEAKIKIFFEEHLHTDEEIRYCLDGTGYFDVRSKEDKWIRIAVEKGEMIILPAGIYHRFTLDEKNYIKAMRLFVGEPVWTPYNRAADGTDAMAARADYVKRFLEGNEPGAKKSRTEAAAATEETAAA